MSVYFGKISTKYDKNQIEGGYYEAPQASTWFNGLSIGDYAYIIGAGVIQLWRAKEWKTSHEGKERFYFDVINSNLGISIEQFVAFDKFYLDVALIVKTTRSTAVEQKAFFPIKTIEYEIEDFSLFEDDNNYRKVINRITKERVIDRSNDIQLYFTNDSLEIAEIAFADISLVERFNGNILNCLGKGSKNKDKVIREILHEKFNDKLLNKIKIQQIYDTFMCKYVEKNKMVERNYWVVNGFDHEKIFYDIENNMFVMQQQYNEQNNSTVSGLLGKCKEIKEGDGVLLYNNNRYYAYGEFKSVDFDTDTIFSIDQMRKLKANLDNQFVSFNDAECYFEDTRSENGFEGDYGQRILVEEWNGVNLSGNHIYGIGYETSMVNTTIIKLKDNRFYDKVVKILDGDKFYLIEEEMKKLKALIEFKKQIVLQGPPGTGKTYTAKDLSEYLLTENVSFDKKEQADILNLNPRFEIIQFHPAYTYEDFIRGIVTEAKGSVVEYKPKDKLFLELVNKASKDQENPYILIIDEINRANLPSVLGELIYALEYRNETFKSMYADINGVFDISIPDNLYIIGTMNTADRSVGHLDYALRRRFAFYDVLPKVCEDDNFEKDLFELVSQLFVKEIKSNVQELKSSEHLSIEFQDRPQDIWLGHSYFFKKGESDFSLRIQYEIVPILHEYVKDGILNNTDEVKELIKKIGGYQIADADS